MLSELCAYLLKQIASPSYFFLSLPNSLSGQDPIWIASGERRQARRYSCFRKGCIRENWRLQLASLVFYGTICCHPLLMCPSRLVRGRVCGSKTHTTLLLPKSVLAFYSEQVIARRIPCHRGLIGNFLTQRLTCIAYTVRFRYCIKLKKNRPSKHVFSLAQSCLLI